MVAFGKSGTNRGLDNLVWVCCHRGLPLTLSLLRLNVVGKQIRLLRGRLLDITQPPVFSTLQTAAAKEGRGSARRGDHEQEWITYA